MRPIKPVSVPTVKAGFVDEAARDNKFPTI
jgi:hypothetical protein